MRLILAKQPLRITVAIFLAAAIQCAAGCAAWQTRDWDFSQLRDPRASDLDRRLSERPDPSGAAFADTASLAPSGADGQGADTPPVRR